MAKNLDNIKLKRIESTENIKQLYLFSKARLERKSIRIINK
jgi:hypothetical protein